MSYLTRRALTLSSWKTCFSFFSLLFLISDFLLYRISLFHIERNTQKFFKNTHKIYFLIRSFRNDSLRLLNGFCTTLYCLIYSRKSISSAWHSRCWPHERPPRGPRSRGPCCVAAPSPRSHRTRGPVRRVGSPLGPTNDLFRKCRRGSRSIFALLKNFGTLFDLMLLRSTIPAEKVETKSAVSEVDVIRSGWAVDTAGNCELPGLFERVEAVLVEVVQFFNQWLVRYKINF